ncbi:class I SAM-dependent methyltransferase [Methylophaga nitratireducenticrescens]|uniref:SAM-dependent methyltransferase n=1 Tax=Methylophaga nitratireducenticrescens TaxID=754476 RepID=I1XHA7_METNJ|nr:class I SAM-dependent methyltransferase [Methylophaga nitratireducenticrescens]AFI83776.1 SAM-dependent methyltransferase [Methylophaga nitratireducenticrescens]AUZ83901.1 SAM-dependent methyltransferase [Methylophaga nitratireducenticrescens]
MEAPRLASQLRCPNGVEAPEVAKRMNDANRVLNHKCIDLLQLRASDSLLEIGPGNGAFVVDIINAADNISYTGLDWSPEMVAEAQRLNVHLVEQERANFLQGSSEQILFEANSFDKVMAVHTLYFLENPGDHLMEIRRVMKPGGQFCIAYGDRSFMKDLPFVPYGFNLYDETEALALLRSSGFQTINTFQHNESGLSNTGAHVNKVINIIVCNA